MSDIVFKLDQAMLCHALLGMYERAIQRLALITAPDTSISLADSIAFIMSEYWILPSPLTS